MGLFYFKFLLNQYPIQNLGEENAYLIKELVFNRFFKQNRIGKIDGNCY